MNANRYFFGFDRPTGQVSRFCPLFRGSSFAWRVDHRARLCSQPRFRSLSGVIWSLAVSGMLAILLAQSSLFRGKNPLGRIASILLLYLLVVASCGSAIFLLSKVISQTRSSWGRPPTGLSKFTTKLKIRNMSRPKAWMQYRPKSTPSKILERTYWHGRQNPRPSLSRENHLRLA